MGEPTVVIEKDVPTPMRDGVVLRADVFRPAAPGKCARTAAPWT